MSNFLENVTRLLMIREAASSVRLDRDQTFSLPDGNNPEPTTVRPDAKWEGKTPFPVVERKDDEEPSSSGSDRGDAHRMR